MLPPAVVASSTSRPATAAGLVKVMLGMVTANHNATPPLSKGDHSAMDSSGGACTSGYCHLGGAPIANAWAYGAGIVKAP